MRVASQYGSFVMGDNGCGCMNCSEDVNIIDENRNILVSLVDVDDRVKFLEKSLQDLQTIIERLAETMNQIYYMPGGPGFIEAKDNFENNIKN